MNKLWYGIMRKEKDYISNLQHLSSYRVAV